MDLPQTPPEKFVESEAEMHADETRKAVENAAHKNSDEMPDKKTSEKE